MSSFSFFLSFHRIYLTKWRKKQLPCKTVLLAKEATPQRGLEIHSESSKFSRHLQPTQPSTVNKQSVNYNNNPTFYNPFIYFLFCFVYGANLMQNEEKWNRIQCAKYNCTSVPEAIHFCRITTRFHVYFLFYFQLLFFFFFSLPLFLKSVSKFALWKYSRAQQKPRDAILKYGGCNTK